jgi:hypothetical protein
MPAAHELLQLLKRCSVPILQCPGIDLLHLCQCFALVLQTSSLTGIAARAARVRANAYLP